MFKKLALVAQQRWVVLLALTVVTVVAFALVSRLVDRFTANEKAVARHVFARGMNAYQAGNAAAALDDFRAALTYDPDNFEYELNLARALRDSGKLPEAAAYLTTLWTKNPEDSVINLALGRLAVRQGNTDEALRYYHNAIYGAWPRDPEENRRRARLELIDFLSKQNATALTEAEILSLMQSEPGNTDLTLQAAGLFANIQRFNQALTAYDRVLRTDPGNAVATAGAGKAAFEMGRYRTARQYLQRALAANPADADSRRDLDLTELVLARDPFLPRVSDAERNRRLVTAFNAAGDRLHSCQAKTNPSADASTKGDSLDSLDTRWRAMQPQLGQLQKPDEKDLPDAIMDLVYLIEQQTSERCGSAEGVDLALMLIGNHRSTVNQ
jgi:tetratricopeptide (TPR) repeat protein